MISHSSIISHLYSNFSQYRQLWEKQWENTEEFGAFVFLPGKELDWEWWAILEVRQYIQDGGLDDEKMLEGIYDFEFGEEFLVMIIEHVGGLEKQEAYFHRMSKVKLN